MMEDNSEDQVPLCLGHLALTKALEFRCNSGEMGLVERLGVAWDYQMEEDFNIN